MTNQPELPEPAPPTIVYLTADPATATRLDALITQQGSKPVATETAATFLQAVDYWFPVLALLSAPATHQDLSGLLAAIRRCKLRPHTRTVPIVAFGLPNQTAAPLDFPAFATEARNAGVDDVQTYSDLFAHLPQRIHNTIHPPTVYPAGWDEPLSEKARKGVEEFNRGEYYEQHEWLEHAWMDETRPIREMYQGVLQVGVAFYHIVAGNWPGAIKMFRRGLPRLRALPPICQGIDIAALRTTAEAIHREVTELGRDRLHEFDASRLPKIRLVDQNTMRG